MDQALLLLSVASLAFLTGRFLFPSRAPGLIEDLRGIQSDLSNLEQQVRREKRRQEVEEPPQPERLIEILLKANSELQDRLLLCLDPLRMRESANLELQRTQLEVQAEAIRAQAAAPQDDQAERRARLVASLRARQASEEEPEDFEPDEPEDLDPLPGELDLPARPQVLVGHSKPKRSRPPRTAMGQPARTREDHLAALAAAAPAAQFVEQVEEQEQEQGLDPRDFADSLSGAEPASPLND